MKIRPATEADRDAIWNIFHEVVADGDTYALDPKIAREDALAYWFAPGTHTYVAQQPAIGIAGTYILRPNQSGGGSHVANAGFMVSASARGQGIGRAMAEHCLSEARRLGFREPFGKAREAWAPKRLDPRRATKRGKVPVGALDQHRGNVVR